MVDLEKALVLLADNHHRYLWRQDGKGHGEKGKQGWGFTCSLNSVAQEVFPTIAEAIKNEIQHIEQDASAAEARAAATTELMLKRSDEAKALRKAMS